MGYLDCGVNSCHSFLMIFQSLKWSPMILKISTGEQVQNTTIIHLEREDTYSTNWWCGNEERGCWVYCLVWNLIKYIDWKSQNCCNMWATVMNNECNFWYFQDVRLCKLLFCQLRRYTAAVLSAHEPWKTECYVQYKVIRKARSGLSSQTQYSSIRRVPGHGWQLIPTNSG